MLGYTPFLYRHCVNCSRGKIIQGDEVLEILVNKKLDSHFKCPECEKESTYLDAIIRNFLEYDLNFVSDSIYSGFSEITIGVTEYVSLPVKMKQIFKINISVSYVGWADCWAEPIDDSTFMICSSEAYKLPLRDLEAGKVGDKTEVRWEAFGVSDKAKFIVWNEYLVEAKNQLINGRYKMAYISCAIAFESYVDTVIKLLLTKKSIPIGAINRITEDMGNIKNKYQKLLSELDGIKFTSNKELNKEMAELIEYRNKIAHGTDFEISESQARNAFEKVVRSILFAFMESSLSYQDIWGDQV